MKQDSSHFSSAILEQWHAQHRSNIFQFFQGKLPKNVNSSIPDDLTQEVFMRAHRSLKHRTKEEEIISPKAWLLKIASRVYADFIATTKREPFHFSALSLSVCEREESEGIEGKIPPDDSRDTSPEHMAVESEFHRWLLQAVHALPQHEQNAIIAHCIDVEESSRGEST